MGRDSFIQLNKSEIFPENNRHNNNQSEIGMSVTARKKLNKSAL